MNSKIGGKRGRKAATGNFTDLKTKNLGELSYKDCMSLTLQNIRKTNAYKQLTPSRIFAKNKEWAKRPKGVFRHGCKSTASKANLCRFLANPDEYYKVVIKAANQNRKEDKKLYKKRDRTGQRVGHCVPKSRTPDSSGKCKSNRHGFTNEGLTTTGVDCCFQRPQSKGVSDKRRAKKGSNINKVPTNKQITAAINKIFNNMSSPNKATQSGVYSKLHADVFHINLSSKKKFIYRQVKKHQSK